VRLTRFEKVEVLAKSKKPDNASNTDENGSDILQDAEDSARDISENLDAKPDEITEPQTEAAIPELLDPEETPAEDGPSEDAPEGTNDDAMDTEPPSAEPETVDLDAQDPEVEASTDDTPTDIPDEPVAEDSTTNEDMSAREPVEETEPQADIAEDTERDTADASDTEPDSVLETPETPEPEPAERKSEPEPKIIRETQVVKGSMWPGIFGGIVAALVGFVAGRGEMLDAVLPETMQRPAIDMSAVDAVTEQAAALAAATEAQAARIDALEAAPGAAPVEGLGADALDGVAADLAALAARIDALEARPDTAETTGASQEALAALDSVAALEATLAEQAERLAELTAAAETAEANAESEAARILARAALARVEVAVDSGEPYDGALASLEEVAPVEVPEPLRAAAEAGVPTLLALQASFPDAARVGLAAARAEVPEAEVDGVTGFLRRQLNVRSTVPREGSDPDAVLSRAEAAVSAGDLDLALTEMEALPDAARAAMNDWLEAASARKAAQDAARALADSLSSN